jgi:hypothetical protein
MNLQLCCLPRENFMFIALKQWQRPCVIAVVVHVSRYFEAYTATNNKHV